MANQAQDIVLVFDQYRKVRGGYSRLFKVSCEKCSGLVCYYQKDGPGPLKRMYSDRIMKPKITWKLNGKLSCKKCRKWLGIAAMYEKEKRKCFILFQDVVSKEITKV